MAEVINSNYDAFASMLSMAVFHRQVPSGHTKKSAEISEARSFGFIDGIASSMAAVATERRIEMIREVLGDDNMEEGGKWIEAVPSYEVRSMITRLRKNEPPRDQFNQNLDAYMTELEDIIWPEAVASTYEGIRRKLIKEGKIQPTERDVPWLKEERDLFEAMTKPFDALLKKAEK